MLLLLRSAIARRSLAGSLFLSTALAACAAQAASFTMYRDAHCGCCLAWAEHVKATNEHEVQSVEHPDMASVKAENGVPGDLQSCHTAIVEGYVIEGHVPVADVERLLAERPTGVKGLAVAGMPMGSPGMEHGNHHQAFQVVAFGLDGRSVWASYPASH
ncbi:DUF411 domain-containing protein [Qipengyuania sp. SS22]|uniref:DUF411 domain-containing protein n=1 Tax=Qipengyuania sp. SS22 TaxID=2979461 RepID=UPI0021E5C724|nr:DUF411 domain-containing protein [Qipengyuania sp. SS22]UYH55544.1 DUF411 domain-containing protein [Qipengyuania sp. SS22]